MTHGCGKSDLRSPRPSSPSRDSILMTSAPISPIMAVDTGPNCHIVQSRTLIPFNGPVTSIAGKGFLQYLYCSVYITRRLARGNGLQLPERS